MSAIPATESVESAEKRAKRFWMALVVFLFILQGTIMGLVMHLAIGDPSSAVVPDYHNAALNWDQTRRTLDASRRLGWDVQFSASDVADTRGMRALELHVVDADGKGVDELSVSGRLYHHARAGDVHEIELKAVGRGKYLTLAPAARAGLWQLEVSIEGAAEPVAESITFDVEG